MVVQTLIFPEQARCSSDVALTPSGLFTFCFVGTCILRFGFLKYFFFTKLSMFLARVTSSNSFIYLFIYFLQNSTFFKIFIQCSYNSIFRACHFRISRLFAFVQLTCLGFCAWRYHGHMPFFFRIFDFYVVLVLLFLIFLFFFSQFSIVCWLVLSYSCIHLVIDSTTTFQFLELCVGPACSYHCVVVIPSRFSYNFF